MLSDHERRAWDAIEHELADQDLPAGPPSRRRDGRHPVVRAVLVALGSVALLLLATGAVSGALALAAATALGWLSWRWWPQLRDDGAATVPARPDGGTVSGAGRRPGAQWLSRHLKRISEGE